MEQVKTGSARIVIVVAMALIVHVWMLNTSMTSPGMDPPAEHAPVLAAPTTADLPTTSHCAFGRSACMVSDPDDGPAVVTPALLVAAGGTLWMLRRLVSDLGRLRARARHARCPPHPCVPASVVLLQ